jgi:hypothetical protein
VDGGATWTPMTMSVNTLNSVFFPDETTGYAAGIYCTMLKTGGSSIVGQDQVASTTDKVRVFPNPVHDLLNVETTGDREILQYSLFSLNQEALISQSLRLRNFQIDMKSYPRGVYFLRLKYHGGFETIKVIKE